MLKSHVLNLVLKIVYSLPVIFVCLLSGCANSQIGNNLNPTIPHDSGNMKKTPIVEVEVTNTTKPEPNMPEDSPDDYHSWLISDCVTLHHELPNEIPIAGLLVLEPSTKDSIYSSLYNPITREHIDFGVTNWPIVKVSPSLSKLAFWDIDKEEMIVIASDGSSIATLSIPKQILLPMLWITENEILVERVLSESFKPFEEHKYFSWNLQTGFQEDVNLPTPFFSAGEDDWWYTDPLYIVNQTKSHLVYPDSFDVVLWDLVKNEEVQRLYYAVKWGAPKWSPYGDEFVVSAPPSTTGYGEIFQNIDDGFPYVGGNDLFLINTKGEIRRISYITTIMTVGEEEFSWSPNGKQIAFWLYFLDESFDESYLAIVDIETGVTTNLCLKGFGEISWSPDGKYLGFTSIVSESGQDDYFGVIVDIENNQGYYIPEKGYINGWMKP